ncbi:diguanylate cyclase [Vibrio ponticus]|nr:diguanylate cyclase [Vibrio ponticus]
MLLEVGIIWLALGLGAGIFTLMFEAYRRNKIDHAFTNLLLESGSAIVLTDSQFNILKANGLFMELTGLHHEQLIGAQVTHLQQLPISSEQLQKALHQYRYWKGCSELRTTTEQLVSCEVEIRPLNPHQPNVHYFVHAFTDISVHQQRIAQLQALSECDSATNLWNKAKFEALLSNQAQLIARYKNHPPSCLAIIDIDDFKLINDSRGHAFGDQAILHVSHTLRQVMRDSDAIGRIGGDEFAMIIQHVDTKKALLLMRRVSQEVARWSEYPITISVGIAPIGANWQSCYELADNCLYRAKKSGRNCVIAHGINNLVSIDHHSA